MAVKPVKLHVSSGSVKRSSKHGRFAPYFTVYFSDGSKKKGYRHVFGREEQRPVLKSVSPEIIVRQSSHLARKSGVPDGMVTCTWSYTAGGVTVVATSQVTVLGQPQRLEISDGSVKRSSKHGRFAPYFTVYFSDGSKKSGYRHVFGNEEQRPALESVSPEIIEGQLSHLARKSGVPDGMVTCTWSYTEGVVTVTATSQVQVLGQPESLAVSHGEVKPGEKFYPYFNLKFTDGAEQKGYYHVLNEKNLLLLSITPDVLHFRTSGFDLKSDVEDGIAVCDWRYMEGDIAVFATSTVQVKVQDLCLSEPENVSEDSVLEMGQTLFHSLENRLTPITTPHNEVTFTAGRPSGSPLFVRVEGAFTEPALNENDYQIRDLEYSVEKDSLMEISIPLFPNAVNHISFFAKEVGTEPDPLKCWIISQESSQPQLLAAPYPPQARGGRKIGDPEMQEFVRRSIEEAKKYSKDLAEYLKERSGEKEFWKLWNNKDNTTDRNKKIKLSRRQLRAALESIKNATNAAEKARREKIYIDQYIEILLHEAGHRKALFEKKYKDHQGAEDVRNTTELINRLIDILHQLNKILCNKTPDTNGDGSNLYKNLTKQQASLLFDKIKKMIEQERRYREKRLEDVKPILDLVAKAWRETVRNIAGIRRSSTLQKKQKIQYAKDHIRNFLLNNSGNLAFIAEKTGIIRIYYLEEQCIIPKTKMYVNGMPTDKEIPRKNDCR